MKESDIQKRLHAEMRARFPQVPSFGNPMSEMEMRGMSDKLKWKTTKSIKAAGWEAGQPDYYIDSPKGIYSGARLELKLGEKQNPFRITKTRDAGPLMLIEHWNDNGIHLRKQAEWLSMLQKQGYFASFVWGMEPTISLAKRYMGLEDGEKIEMEEIEYQPYYSPSMRYKQKFRILVASHDSQ